MRVILISTLLFFSVVSHSQNSTATISGQVVSEVGNPIPFITVTLINGGKPISGGVTNSMGEFSFSAPLGQEYTLKVSGVGYKSYISASFDLSLNENRDVSTIQLLEDIEKLDEVEVTALRPDIIMEADKMIVSVEGTAMAQGSTAFEVLERSPGVFVDQNGNIQLNGRSSVRIMIDGRPTYLSPQDLKNVLEAMPADNIKAIEIISNPSAKYDAAGQAGILDIKLKKNTLYGLSGNAGSGIYYNGDLGHHYNGRINYKKGKWNLSTDANHVTKPRGRESTMFREFNGTESNSFSQRGNEIRIINSNSLRLGLDYQFNEHNLFGVIASYSTNNQDNDFQTVSNFNGINSQAPIVEAQNLIQSDSENKTLNLHSEHTFEESGVLFKGDFNKFIIRSTGNSTFFNDYYNSNNSLKSAEKLESHNPSNYDIQSGQIDLEHPKFLGGTLETGVKYSHVKSDNDLQFYFLENVATLDENRSNHFIYNEEISAGYASYAHSFGEKWSFKVGLRLENTKMDGYSITLDSTTIRNYLNLFPSAFVQHSLSENYQINFSYSRRIDRPNYGDLNPFIFYLDPYTWAKGNPLLLPQYTHAFQLRHTIKKNYNLILGYSQTTGFISEVPIQDVENLTTIFNRDNIDDSYSLSANLIVPISITKKWNINTNATFWHQEFSSFISNQKIRNSQTSINIQSTNTWILGKTFRSELIYTYRSPIVHGLYRLESNWGFDIAVRKSFMQNKLNASFIVHDPFKTRRITGSADVPPNVNRFDQYFNIRAFRLSLSYSFSRGERFRSANRKVDSDELSRVGEQ